MANVVLVHGAWADGSSWSSVIGLLQAAGHKVTAVQIPLTALNDDVARVLTVLAAQDGPTILVGHSYGGAVISAVGPDAPNVVGLVYIAAFVPDEGETMKALTSGDPQPVGISAVRPDTAGFLWLDPDGFVKYFAPDIDPVQARILAAAQKPIAAAALLGDQPLGPVAWKSFPSWYLLTQDDQMIPPPAQQLMAGRAGATVTGIPSSHVPMLSHPDVVTAMIMSAVTATS